jgi:hypothetical protein
VGKALAFCDIDTNSDTCSFSSTWELLLLLLLLFDSAIGTFDVLSSFKLDTFSMESSMAEFVACMTMLRVITMSRSSDTLDEDDRVAAESHAAAASLRSLASLNSAILMVTLDELLSSVLSVLLHRIMLGSSVFSPSFLNVLKMTLSVMRRLPLPLALRPEPLPSAVLAALASSSLLIFVSVALLLAFLLY